jgi:RHS repeat-associated protein
LGLGGGMSLGAVPARSEAKPAVPATAVAPTAAAPPLPAKPSIPASSNATTAQPQPAPSSSGVFYYFNDPNGCPTRLTSASGQVVWAASYTAWGRIATLHVNLVVQPIRLQGQRCDDETGLHYNAARYYEPDYGGFVSQDPVRLNGGHNLYNYAKNVLGWADPLGNAANPANATHITYEGVKDGKPYIGYASKPGLGHSAEDVLKYRYPNVDNFDVAPRPFYVGEGVEGKNTARGLEQRTFEDRGGLDGTSNKQNPVGANNPNRTAYLEAADKHRAARGIGSAADDVADAARKVC